MSLFILLGMCLEQLWHEDITLKKNKSSQTLLLWNLKSQWLKLNISVHSSQPSFQGRWLVCVQNCHLSSALACTG